MLSSSSKFRNILVELNNVGDFDRVVLIVLRIKVALDNDIRLELSNLRCQRCVLDAIDDILDDEVGKKEGLGDLDECPETDLLETGSPHYHLVTSLSKDFAMCLLGSVAGWTMPSASPMQVLRAGPCFRIESLVSSVCALAAMYCDPTLLTKGAVSHIFAFTP